MINIKKKLKNKELTVGTWITIANNSIVEIAADANFDWLVIDLEHSSININQAEDIIRIIELKNKVPLARLSSIDNIQIKRLLDSGARGLIIPMISNSKQIETIIQMMRYPPVGKRSVGLARAHKYGSNFKGYLSTEKKEIVLIVQIEHIDAVNNIEDIMSSKFIDGYMIGPYDLSASLGIPGDFENTLYKRTVNKIKDAGERYGVPSGIHVVEPNLNELKKAIGKNYNFIAYSLDTRILDTAYKAVVLNKK
jgi:2-keto-3-deoxy-L-rhamnonate aldolase RhmA